MFLQSPPLPPLHFISCAQKEQFNSSSSSPCFTAVIEKKEQQPTWIFDEFISLANECIFKTFLEKHSNDLILIGGQAVFANIHPLPTLVQTTDIDVVVKNSVLPTTLNDWFDELEKNILKSWKEWTSTDGSVLYQSQDRDFIAMPHRYMYPRFQYKGFSTSIKLERWMHVHNGICTTSIKASNRRLLDVSLYPETWNNIDLWNSSFLKWMPCPSLRIYNVKKCFATKHTLDYGRLYTQVRIPNTRNLIQLLKKSTTLEAFGNDFSTKKRCFATSKVFQSMERIRLLEMVQQLKLRERFSSTTVSRNQVSSMTRKVLEPLTLMEPKNFLFVKDEEEKDKAVKTKETSPLPVCLYSPVSVSEKTVYTFNIPKKVEQQKAKQQKAKQQKVEQEQSNKEDEMQFLYGLVREKRRLLQEKKELQEERERNKEEMEFEEAREDYDFFSILFFYMLVTMFIFLFLYFSNS